MKNNQPTDSTNKPKQGFGDKNSRLFVAASLLLFLLVLFFSEKPKAQRVNPEDRIVNQAVLSLGVNQAVKDVQDVQEVKAIDKAVNQAVKDIQGINQAVNQEHLSVHEYAQGVQGVNQETSNVNQATTQTINQKDKGVNQATTQTINKKDKGVNQAVKEVQGVKEVNQAIRAVHQDMQNLIRQQIKSSFKQIPFKNLEPAPVNFWYQAQVKNQVVYFSPAQRLMFVGEVYTSDGYSLSQQTRRKWQSQKVAKLDVGDALVIGSGAVEIIEFTDTDCPFCQRFNRWITTQNKVYKDRHNKDLFTRKIVLTPIDGLHPNAHKEAVHILCQSLKNHETALSQTLESKLSLADMDTCQSGKDLLKKHRKIAQAFGVSATPTLVINGHIVQGFNPQTLQVVIKQQLKKQEE